MSEPVAPLVVLKRYFERTDNISPNGGQKVLTSDLASFKASMPSEEFFALAQEAADLLGVELKMPKPLS